MTTASRATNTTANAAPDRPDRHPLPDPGARAVFGSELLKLRSVRSVGIMLAVAVASVALISLISSHDHSLMGPTVVDPGQGGSVSPDRTIYPARVDPTGTLLAGSLVGAAVFAAFGAIAGALEYSSGMIRISLVAVPRRTRFFLGKAAAVAAVALGAASVCTLACYAIGETFFDGQPQDAIGLTTPGVPLHLAGAIVCLTGWTMIGFAFGTLLRSTALGVTVSFVLYIAAPLLVQYFNPTGTKDATPTQAGQALWIYHNPLNPDIAPFGSALAVFLAYVIVLLAAAFVRVARTDA